MDPGDGPGSLGVGGGKDFQAAGGVGGDQLVVGGPHRRVDSEPRPERFAAALAGSVSGIKRVRAVDGRLDGSMILIEQAVARRKGAGLVEFDFLLGFRNLCHRTLQSYGFGGGDDADVVENILGDGAGTVRCLFAFDFSVHDVHADVVEMRFL